jgi:hypothetical protein
MHATGDRERKCALAALPRTHEERHGPVCEGVEETGRQTAVDHDDTVRR